MLGDGSFGTVYRGRCRSQDVAVKVLHRQDLDEHSLNAFRKEVEIVSLCDRKTKNVNEKIQKFNLNSNINVYKDYKEMLDKEEIDILEILLPHHLHHEVTLYAAQKVLKEISVQKPMAICVKDCEEMIEVCKKNNIKLKVFENFTF